MSSAAASAVDAIALPARSATTVRLAGLAGLCAATLVVPALMLVWMPIVLGVPHVASDVRYLVLPLPRPQVIIALVASGLLVAVKAASLSLGVSLLRAEMILVAAWLVAALAVGEKRRSHAWTRHARMHVRRGWMLAALVASIAIVALPLSFAILAAMAHNVVAIVAWLVVRRPDRRHAVIVIAALVAAVALLVVVGPAVAAATGGDVTRWLTVDRAASLMFGGVPLPLARGLMIAFAFLQAVHYAIWLEWIPRRGSARAPAPSARVSLGGYGAMAVMAGTAIVVGAALADPAWTRTTYLALATFHIYLEIVILAVLLARRHA